MGVRCSLLGHRYGEPETEREREERGNEVVETVRRVKVCKLCGDKRVVNENTGVRSVREEYGTDAGEDAESDGRRGAAGDADGLAAAAAAVADDDTGVETDDDRPTETATTDASAGTAGPDASTRTANGTVDPETADDAEGAGGDNAGVDLDLDESTAAAEDDGVILTDDDPESEESRKPWEWPSSDDTRADERVETAATDAGGPTADAAGNGDDGAEGVGSESDADAEFVDAGADGAAAWPDPDGEDESVAAESTSGGTDVSVDGSAPDPESRAGERSTADADGGSGFASAGSVDVGAGDRSAAALVCPECGERTDPGSSLRAGDICPACHRGYLGEEDT